MRFGNIPFGLVTKWRNLDAPLKNGCDRPADRGVQTQMFTRIGARDTRDRAGFAKIAGPILARGF